MKYHEFVKQPKHTNTMLIQEQPLKALLTYVDVKNLVS